MKYTVKKVCEIINGVFLQLHENDSVEHLILDSRKIYFPGYSLFFALNGPRRNGHQFIPELYKKGIRNFIVSEKIQTEFFPEGNFILVPDVLLSLQQLAGYHRSQFKIPVIGITGSNGKTIVKEWLYQLLNEDYNIVRSPKSYNSQIGVPLSVWQMNETHTLAIFEAGISTTLEMEKLERVIQPTIGVLTNIGESHSGGFKDRDEKLSEKLKLFTHCQSMIYCKDVIDHFSQHKAFTKKNKKSDVEIFSWSFDSNDTQLSIKEIVKNNNETTITGIYKEKEVIITIPFLDDASIENAITCWCVMLLLQSDSRLIAVRMKQLMPVNMRLELKKGINHCSVINDSYSADLSSLNIALNFLEQQAPGSKKTVILSDFLQSGMNTVELYNTIASYLVQHSINRVIGIGNVISLHLPSFPGIQKIQQEYFPTTAEFIQHFRFSQFKEETILIKGARMFEFEHIVSMLEQKVHQTVLEINLNALVHNLKQFQKALNPDTKIMAMVKAFSYGSGGAEIAGILQFHNVDYLGVAYADEGVELRKSGITLPVMVMNPERSSFDLLVQYDLEPEIYSFDELEAFDKYLRNEKIQQYPTHIEIETGMNRLGFGKEDIPRLGEYLNKSGAFKVQSVFSHLVASEDKEEDKFTAQQFQQFLEASLTLKNSLGYSFIQHISNSAAIIRHPEMQMDMVRLGIGLYGVNSTNTDELDLQTVATLKSTVAQVKYVEAGESVSYNRKGVVKRNSVIATVRIGYADGYPRRLGNGIGKMIVKNKLAPVVGQVCMDMTMIDVSDIAGVKEGDEVVIIGKGLPVQKIAEWVETIPYEIMTGISQRVKRVYYVE